MWVAISSPLAMTRARVRSLTSPTRATPAAISRSSARWRSTSSPSGTAEVCGQTPVALLDGAQLLLLGLADGRIQQPLEAIGDAGDAPSAR